MGAGELHTTITSLLTDDRTAAERLMMFIYSDLEALRVLRVEVLLSGFSKSSTNYQIVSERTKSSHHVRRDIYSVSQSLSNLRGVLNHLGQFTPVTTTSAHPLFERSLNLCMEPGFLGLSNIQPSVEETDPCSICLPDKTLVVFRVRRSVRRDVLDAVQKIWEQFKSCGFLPCITYAGITVSE